MPFSVMAGLVPAMVRLACGPNAWPTGAPTVSETASPLDDVDGRDIGRSEERPSFDGLCPAMTVGAADVTRFIQGDRPKAGAELAMTASEIAARRSRAANIIASIEGGACGPSVAWLSTTSSRAEFETRWMRAAAG